VVPITSSLTAPPTERHSECRLVDDFSCESLAIGVAQKLKATDVIEALCELFVSRGIPAHRRSDDARIR